jgi:phage repressor protein C with HTH and peptisase S24 domain
MNSDISNRILELIEALNLNKTSFSQKIGLSNNVTISRIINENRKPSFDVLEKILLTFGSLDANWLMKGEGEMFISTSRKVEENDNANDNLSDNLTKKKAHPIAHPSAHPNTVKEELQEYSSSNFQAPQVVTVDSCGQENIVMLDAKAAAGFPANIDNPQYFKDQPSMCIPTHQFKSGTFIAIQATGDSMHPTVYNHDWLFCKYLEDPLNNIREGYIHVLLTKEGVVVKRLLNRIQERGTVVCQSDNHQYPSYEERLDNILQIWKVEAKLSFILRNEGAEVNSRLNNLEADMIEIKRYMKGNGKSV